MTEAAKQQTAEEYVMERWEYVWVYEAPRTFLVRMGEREFRGSPKDKEAIWSAAYAFTLEREEQIRQVEEEIAFLNHIQIQHTCAQDLQNKAKPLVRILATRQAALAELKRGMK